MDGAHNRTFYYGIIDIFIYIILYKCTILIIRFMFIICAFQNLRYFICVMELNRDIFLMLGIL